MPRARGIIGAVAAAPSLPEATMFSRLCLSAGILLLGVTSALPEEPKNVDEALARLAKVKGNVKCDESRQVLEVDI
jgi:hypothetical protein